MGINTDGFDLLLLAFRGLDPGKQVEMLELGNQQVRPPHSDAGPAKSYFEERQIFHVSVDLNGKDGALKLDLNEPIYGLGQFDIVTNFGTTEHVQNQQQVFKNIHVCCREGGYMIHQVPMKGGLRWKGHGLIEYEKKWFELLARVNNYDVLKLEAGPRELIHIVFRKRNFWWIAPDMS